MLLQSTPLRGSSGPGEEPAVTLPPNGDRTSPQRLHQLLHERELELRMAARLAAVGAWRVRLRPLHFEASREWLRLHDHDLATVPPFTTSLALFERSGRRRLLKVFAACARYGTPFDLVLAALTFRGRPVHLRVIGEAQVDAAGTIIAVHGACQDVTELEAHREQLEQLVQKRTRQLREANSELTAFTLAVAHDLRAPLAAIAGFGQALAERLGNADADSVRYLGRLQSAAGRMEAMLQSVMALAQVGQAPLECRLASVSHAAQDVVESLRMREPQRDVTVEIQAGMQAEADRNLLHTILENLVGNAWKFTAGRPRATIRVGQEDSGAFFVADNGAGFDMSCARNLFAPFQRYHTEAEFEGTGIGLAAVRRAVQRHGGTTWALSAPDQGTTVWFTLPACGVPAAADGQCEVDLR